MAVSLPVVPRAAVSARVVGMLLAGIAFGGVIAIVKGAGTGLRYEIGNLAGLWIVVPAIIGAFSRRRWSAFAVASLSALGSLAAFYVTADRFSFSAWSHVLGNRLFFLVVGPMGAGALAAVTRILSDRKRELAGLPLGLALVAEPLTRWLVLDRSSTETSTALIEVVELAFGVALTIWCCRAALRTG